jgi:hypothetical protein
LFSDPFFEVLHSGRPLSWNSPSASPGHRPHGRRC